MVTVLVEEGARKSVPWRRRGLLALQSGRSTIGRFIQDSERWPVGNKNIGVEHQGCPQYECDTRVGFLETAKGKKALKKFADREEELSLRRRGRRVR